MLCGIVLRFCVEWVFVDLGPLSVELGFVSFFRLFIVTFKSLYTFDVFAIHKMMINRLKKNVSLHPPTFDNIIKLTKNICD
jgi:hypothetical protein